MFKILVVDDEAPIRDMLSDALRIFGYEADTAPDGPSALEKLRTSRFDMILSDINMPHMTGFELLRKVEAAHPELKRVLMTAYNLDDYMRMVRDHNVGNVITKTVPLNFKEIREILNSLLNNAIFGLEQYMLQPHSVQTFKLTEPSQIDEISESLSEHYSGTPTHNKFKVVLIELMTNALFYGARNETGDKKQEWVKDFRLQESEAVIVTACLDKEKLGVSVLDGGGKLDKHTVLYWLDRQTTHDENGLPMGIFDYHGRGFFITRKYVDRFIINIEKGKRCECCIFNYFEEKYAGNKPLIINEI
ncbi:MAG: receiver component of a two-component response regulator [Fibrobacteres bacterium]|nr:receiver component of a two-component response regulator [Fibrobacterota bacterium]